MSEEKEFKMTTASDYLKEWIMNFLSKPQESLNGFPPCPFAKDSLLNQKIKFYESDNYVKDIRFEFENWDYSLDVVVFIVPDEVDPETFVKEIKKLNDYYKDKGFLCLEDHKSIPEPFFDLSFNNGKYNIVVCQQIEKINQATSVLLKKGYYKNWNKEMFDQVVSWRQKSLPSSS
jgi:hypothetical protein